MNRLGTAAALIGALASVLISRPAEACGCFAPPDPTVPIVQAGERILFAVNNGVVTAHIQIQYAGDAKDFGWLLPLPSVPTLKLGTEELFAQLISTTQPRYFVTTKINGSCAVPLFNASSPAAAGSFEDRATDSPLVTQSSIGPYDYAVLKADSKDEMFKWLTDNHYFIPAGTDSTVGPYIHAGGYFLALKLKSGQSAGDIQPVVLTYPSDLPMIPIILTSVAAQPNMGVQVWMLGSARAIPRNYNHVVINDAQLDWLGGVRNYNDVVIRAISETPEKHAFITEYAGPSGVMVGQLDSVGRFGARAELAALSDPADFVAYLYAHGYAPAGAASQPGFPPQPQRFPAFTRDLLMAAIPIPADLRASLTDEQWLGDLRNNLSQYIANHPGWKAPHFDAEALAAQLDEKVAQPALEAGQLFRNFPVLTRLYTTLSPEDMTRDPVFSFNSSLPDVSRDHTATLTVDCNVFTDFSHAARTLTTEQGFVVAQPTSGSTPRDLTIGPSSLRIETLPEEGAAKVLTDNTAQIKSTVAACGCTSVEPLSLGLLGLVVLLSRRSRRAN